MNNNALLELTLSSIKDGIVGLDEFQKLFEDISNLFENGEDVQALQQLSNLSQYLSDFASFSATLTQNSVLWLTELEIQPLIDAGERLEKFLISMLNEAEKHNYIEVADILRYDLIPSMDFYREIFSNYIVRFEEMLTTSV